VKEDTKHMHRFIPTKRRVKEKGKRTDSEGFKNGSSTSQINRENREKNGGRGISPTMGLLNRREKR